jgi:hypothetical protein
MFFCWRSRSANREMTEPISFRSSLGRLKVCAICSHRVARCLPIEQLLSCLNLHGPTSTRRYAKSLSDAHPITGMNLCFACSGISDGSTRITREMEISRGVGSLGEFRLSLTGPGHGWSSRCPAYGRGDIDEEPVSQANDKCGAFSAHGSLTIVGIPSASRSRLVSPV